jgi:hypothetical protein
MLIVIGRAIAVARQRSEEFCHPFASADGSPAELAERYTRNIAPTDTITVKTAAAVIDAD